MTFVAGFGLVLLFFLLIYCLFILKVLSGLHAPVSARQRQPSEMVSVIISVRNEEALLARCLESLLAQDYPRESYEIVAIDDGSTDSTANILRAYANEHAHIRVITMAPGPGHKRAALIAGIKEAAGELLLFTDGDCIVKPAWIRQMASALSGGHVFVAGPVVETVAPGTLPQLSRMEFLGLIGVAAGLIRSGNPIFCNGANIAYRKSTFEAIGGFGSDSHFSDDEVILQRFHARDPESVLFTLDEETVVSTPSADSPRSFWQQRVRWSSKRGVYTNKSILGRLILLYFFFLVLFAGLLVSPYIPGLLTFIVPALVIKFLADTLVILKTARLLNQSVSALYLVIAELLHVPYIVVAALQGQTGSLRWKGASFRK